MEDEQQKIDAIEPATGAALVSSAAPEWAASFDDETKEFVSTKGWKDPAQSIQSYRELEKKFGADRAGKTMVMPDAEDVDGWGQVYAKLGRPDTPDGYGLQDREGADAEFIAAMGPALHESGMSKDGAAKLADAFDAYSEKAVEARNTEFLQTSEKELLDLRRGWGSQFDAKIAEGKAAAKQFGFSDGELDKMERALGTKAMLERLANIGAQLGEDRMPGDTINTGGVDPETEIKRLMTDADFKAKLNGGDALAKEKWDNLHKALVQQKERKSVGR